MSTDTAVRRHVYLFRPRFVGPIIKGTKTQTVRSPRKREPRPGDLLSLRAWSRKPYRSPQVEVARMTCLSVEPITIDLESFILPSVEIGGRRLSQIGLYEFAVADGFRGCVDLVQYYVERKVSHFIGVLIRWAPGEPS